MFGKIDCLCVCVCLFVCVCVYVYVCVRVCVCTGALESLLHSQTLVNYDLLGACCTCGRDAGGGFPLRECQSCECMRVCVHVVI